MFIARGNPLVLVPASTAATTDAGRFTQLEALRGIAAVIVVAWHFLWAFDPSRLGIVSGFDPSSAMLGSVAFASIDGPAAVILFFVLSGFVLPLGFFRSGRRDFVIRAAAKRWLRLMGLALLATIFSYALFRFGLYRHREAAVFSQSAWLGTFGGSVPQEQFTPSLPAALIEGSLLAFLRDPDVYDPVLWTMHHEFLGSFVSLFMAMLLWQMRWPLALWFLASAAIIMAFTDPWLIAFVAGTGLAWSVSYRELRLSIAAALGCIALGIFLFGYLEPRGAYVPFAAMHDSGPHRFDRIGMHTVGSALIVLGLVSNRWLGTSLTAPGLQFLGRLSFPIYLFHFPLLCSLASASFIALRPAATYNVALLLVACLYVPAILGVGYVFARVDEAWGGWVNQLAAYLIGSHGNQTSTARVAAESE